MIISNINVCNVDWDDISFELSYAENSAAVEDTFKMRFSQEFTNYIIYECHYPSGYCISTEHSIDLDEPYEFLFFAYLSENPTQTYSFAPSASFG